MRSKQRAKRVVNPSLSANRNDSSTHSAPSIVVMIRTEVQCSTQWNIAQRTTVLAEPAAREARSAPGTSSDAKSPVVD